VFAHAVPPHAADQAGQRRQAAEAAGGGRGDRATRAGPGEAESGAEYGGIVKVAGTRPVVGELQRAAERRGPGAAQRRQAGGGAPGAWPPSGPGSGFSRHGNDQPAGGWVSTR
jgi:hypothetical protein